MRLHSNTYQKKDQTMSALEEATVGLSIDVKCPTFETSVDRENNKVMADSVHAAQDRAKSKRVLILSSDRRELTAAIASIRNTWRSFTWPWPEDGIRLIRKERVQLWHNTANALRDVLHQRRDELLAELPSLRAKARESMGNLFDNGEWDKMSDSIGGITFTSFHPSLRPDQALVGFADAVYNEQCKQAQAKYEVALAQQNREFAAKLLKLAERLKSRLDAGKQFTPEATEAMAILAQSVSNSFASQDIRDAAKSLESIVGHTMPNPTDALMTVLSTLDGYFMSGVREVVLTD